MKRPGKSDEVFTDEHFPRQIIFPDKVFSHPRPQGSRIFYDAKEPKTVYECKCVDPWNTQFKNIQILYILKRPLEKVGWTALKQRGIEWDESTFLREAFEKLTAWTQNQVERRDFIKRRSLLDLCCLEYVLNVIWWVPRHVQADNGIKQNLKYTPTDQGDQTRQIRFWETSPFTLLNWHPIIAH